MPSWRVRSLALFFTAATFLHPGSMQSRSGEPLLELEKPIYAEKESIRLWVGVKSAESISEDLQRSCILHVVRPDGSRLEWPVPWPIDGDASHGWKGGQEFPGKPQPPGAYTVAFEYAGKRTADQVLTIVKSTIMDAIQTQWIFFEAFSGNLHVRQAMLRVQNRTSRALRLPEPGLESGDSAVWMSVQQFHPPSGNTFPIGVSIFAPTLAAPNYRFDRFDWDNMYRWPTVTIPPGGSVERSFQLQTAFPFRNGEEYEVRLSTVLPVFVGSKYDPDFAFFPLRIPVSYRSRFRW